MKKFSQLPIHGVISVKIHIHPLTIALLVISCFTGDIRFIITAYAVMTGHELSHLLASKCIGLNAESFTFMPFGVNLRLKNKIVHTFSDEIILYAAGPFFNGVFAVISIIFDWDMLYRMNTALFIMNILPIVPLDGGMILFRILANQWGNIAARRVLNAVSFILALFFASVALFMALRGEMNLSMIIMSLFLLGNIITTKEKYNADFIAAMSGAKKKTNNVRVVLIEDENDTLPAVKAISPMYTVIGAVKNNDDKIERLMTENEIMEGFSLIEK